MENNTTEKAVLGLGKVSTAYYYDRINANFNRKNSEFSTFPFLLYQIDFQEINPFLPQNFSVLIPKLQKYFIKLSELGVKKLLVPNITLHETLDQMNLPFQICHPIDLAISFLKENNISEAFVFGSLYSMNSEYFHQKFRSENIKILKPTNDHQNWLDQFRKEVANESVSTSQISEFKNIIEEYATKNPVLIACTELSVHSVKDFPNCIDLAELQIKAFLD